MEHMRSWDRALQAAIAEEIGADLGRMHRSAAWLRRQAGVSDSAYRLAFGRGAISRSPKLEVLASIAEVLGLSTSELIRRGEANLDAHLRRLLQEVGASDAEIAALLAEREKRAQSG